MQGQRKSLREWSQLLISQGYTQATPNFLMGKLNKKIGDVVSYEELQAALGNGSSQQTTNTNQSTGSSQQGAGTVGMVGEVAADLATYIDQLGKNLALQGKQELTHKTAHYLSLPESVVRESLGNSAAPQKGSSFEDFFSSGAECMDLSQLLGQERKLPQLAGVAASSTSNSLPETSLQTSNEPSTQPQGEKLESSEATSTTENL